MSLAGRIALLTGAALAALGGLALSSGRPPPGAPFPLVPALAVLLGAAVFGFGSRRDRPDAPGPPLTRPEGVPSAGHRRLILPVALAALVSVGYAVLGYHTLLLFAWFGNWALATRALWPLRRRDRGTDRLAAGEIWLLVGVVAVVAILVLPYLDGMPYEISTDEIYSVTAVRDFARGATRNALGLVSWWGLPAGWFWAVARLSPLTGTSLEAVRLVTALTALLIPPAVYVWVRTLHGRTIAAIAAVLVALAHASIGWARLALNQNSAVLLLAAALALLALGTRRRCPVRLLWSGIALGLGFYTYPSGQLSIAIAVATLAAWRVGGGIRRGSLGAIAVPLLAGFALAIGPMLVNAITHSAQFAERANAVAMTNPAVVSRLGATLGLETTRDIVLENLRRGLLAFNVPYPYVTYYNPFAPFVDPATGALLWLGLAAAIARPRAPGTALAAIGFLAVYAAGLVTEGAPVHGRLLPALPFVAVLAAVALDRLGRALLGAGGAPRTVRRRGVGLAVATVAIVILNLVAYRGFVRHQLATGPNDAVTAIGRRLRVGIGLEGPVKRYLGQGHRWDPRHHVFFLSPREEPLFRWAAPADWRQWIAFFSDGAHVHEVETIDDFLPGGAESYAQGFWTRITLFLPTAVWERSEPELRARFPDLAHEVITPNRRITALEIHR